MNFSNAGPLLTLPIIYVYRKPAHQLPSLNLYLFPWGFCICIFGTLLAMSALNSTIHNSFRSCQIYKRFVQKFSTRTTCILGIFILVFSKYFSSSIVLIFHTPESYKLPISDSESLVEALESSQFTAVTDTKHICTDFLNPICYQNSAGLKHRLLHAAR